MQTWWATGRTQVSATLDFEGTGVEAYFLMFWRSQDPNSNGEGNLLFFVDDKLEMTRPIVASDYRFTADIAPRALIFSKSGYSAGKHTLRIHWTNNGPRPRVAVALDKIEYTAIPAAPAPTTNAPAVTTNAPSPSTTATSPTTGTGTSTTAGGRASGDTTDTNTSSLTTTTSASDATGTGLSGAAGPPDSGAGGSGSSSNGGSGGTKDNNGGVAAGSQGDQTGATSNNTAKIVGSVVAVVVVVAFLIAGFLFWRRRRRHARSAKFVDETAPNPFAPSSHESSPFNHAIATNAPTMYMAAGSQYPVSQVPQPMAYGAPVPQQQQPYTHQRTLSPDSNSQYSWNAASAYTGITTGSGGSNPFVASSEGAPMDGAVAASNATFSPPPYTAGVGPAVSARGDEKRRVGS